MDFSNLDGYRLSPHQKYLWSLQEQAGYSQAFITSCCIKITGSLKTDILELALQNTIDRYEILRTSFFKPPGLNVPVQVISDKTGFEIESVDLKSGHDLDSKATIITSVLDDQQQNISLETLPLLQVKLIRQSSSEHLLHLSLPSLCADAATVQNLVAAIASSYKAIAASSPDDISSDDIFQYADFAEWQHELLEEHNSTRQKADSEHNPSALTYDLSIPFENESPAAGNSNSRVVEKTIPSPLLKTLEDFSSQNGVSVRDVLFCGLNVLLYRLSGDATVTVGIATDDRNDEELASIVGLVTKYIPVSSRFDEEDSIDNTLKIISSSVRDVSTYLDSYSWGDVSDQSDTNSHSDSLKILFDFEDISKVWSASGPEFSITNIYSCIDAYKLRLSCIRDSNELTLSFYYDANIYCSEQIEQVAERFGTLLESMIESSSTAIKNLSILGQSEKSKILFDFNNAESKYSCRQGIHQYLELQAKSTPDAVAIVFEKQSLTYSELNCRANQLARYLQDLGIGQESCVGLCVERSLDAVVGLFGILKAGGAYVPLDPKLPAERFSLALEESQASVLVTQESLASSTSAFTGATVRLDTHWDKIRHKDSGDLPNQAAPQNLVYILYTSGSTGTPKGVAVEHQQLINYSHAVVERLSLQSHTSFATVSTLAADLGNTMIFAALITGGCLHVMSTDRITDPDALAEYFCRHKIDCLKIVPSHLEALLTAAEPAKVLPRQRLILGGEASRWSLVRKIRELAPNLTINNHYGPTETTVGVTTYEAFSDRDAQWASTLPIGRPLPNLKIYILDAQLRPVPIGIPGELYAGGAGVTRGYLNRPDLTDSRFISNPFSESPGDRLYKTGDLARYLPDGTIEFLGRIDGQVKIRGYRIELGDIEASLAEHSAVEKWLVLARDDQPGQQQLVAYGVASADMWPSIRELRQRLQQSLPDYMVPVTYVRLDKLPLTANGKVDHRALPKPDASDKTSNTDYVAPRTPIEKQLASMWCEILQRPQVSTHDDFFELGGHSLLAAQMIVRIRGELGIEIDLRNIFEVSILSELASLIEVLHGSLQQIQEQECDSALEDDREVVEF